MKRCRLSNVFLHVLRWSCDFCHWFYLLHLLVCMLHPQNETNLIMVHNFFHVLFNASVYPSNGYFPAFWECIKQPVPSGKRTRLWLILCALALQQFVLTTLLIFIYNLLLCSFQSSDCTPMCSCLAFLCGVAHGSHILSKLICIGESQFKS
jgi:hypothetical protein